MNNFLGVFFKFSRSKKNQKNLKHSSVSTKKLHKMKLIFKKESFLIVSCSTRETPPRDFCITLLVNCGKGRMIMKMIKNKLEDFQALQA